MSFFDVAYGGSPTWDIGRPQGAVVRLAEAGEILGSVLDVGCGTGENTLFLSGAGLDVVGIDLAGAAIERARAKARDRGLDVEFRVWDALRLADLERTFDTVVDVGMFHTLQDDERPVYAASLRAALRPAGRCFLLCWSDRNVWGYGPRRIAPGEIRETFAVGWTVVSIEADVLESKLSSGEVHAWLARLVRAE